MKLYTLGTSHGATEKGRACSGNLLEVNGKYYLLDCGANVEGKMTDMGLPIKDIKAVFISHMHEDHVGNLSAIVKRFYHYNRTDDCVTMFLPEQNGIDVFKKWIDALHIDTTDEKVSYNLVSAGEIYADENVTVTAIPTKHMFGGLFPSYAFMVKTKDKNFIYTGDLWKTFEDYPKIILEEDFDAVLCELVHFNVEKNMDVISKSKTRKIIFTHMSMKNIPLIKSVADKFPYEIYIAEDSMCFEI